MCCYGHGLKPQILCSPHEVLSLSELSLKNSLRNNRLRQSSAQLACWLPTLSEIAFKGFHMFANQLLLTCVKFPSLLLPSHFVHKNTRLLILESTDAFWTFASGLLLLQTSPKEVTHSILMQYVEIIRRKLLVKITGSGKSWTSEVVTAMQDGWPFFHSLGNSPVTYRC